jgi:hypothetical protein
VRDARGRKTERERGERERTKSLHWQVHIRGECRQRDLKAFHSTIHSFTHSFIRSLTVDQGSTGLVWAGGLVGWPGTAGSDVLRTPRNKGPACTHGFQGFPGFTIGIASSLLVLLALLMRRPSDQRSRCWKLRGRSRRRGFEDLRI